MMIKLIIKIILKKWKQQNKTSDLFFNWNFKKIWKLQAIHNDQNTEKLIQNGKNTIRPRWFRHIGDEFVAFSDENERQSFLWQKKKTLKSDVKQDKQNNKILNKKNLKLIKHAPGVSQKSKNGCKIPAGK
jgi:hypothetical protein